MTTVNNKSRKPLSVPLPGGKTLHLGPGKTGQIASKAVEHPQVKKLLDAGEIEIVDEGPRSAEAIRGQRRGRAALLGHASKSGTRRSGDR
jgi:hypothetical protein